ncbi:MAG TPA: MFS transporter [Jatrophihabitans sp.]|nr:MFS transporter [Jatrophihabitans sp.]
MYTPTRRGHLRRALAGAGFRRLYAVRLAAQFGDGMFQASLAGAVLFNPERQAHAADIASGFAVLLLPYSVLGPFAGVLLDRWWRQRVLHVANLVRAAAVLGVAAEIAAGFGGIGFYASALVILSIGRFVLSALSASLPRVVADAELVTANAFATTSGTLVAAIGAGAALGLRAVLGADDTDYAVIAAASALAYLLAGLIATGFPRTALGPSEAERRTRETAGEVVRGLVDGARHAWDTTPVRNALAMTGVQRLCYGVTTVSTLLLYRNYFTSHGFFRAGLAGLSQVVTCLVIGGALAAVGTPLLYRRYGAVRLPAALLLTSAATLALFVLPYSMPLQLVAALLLGFAAQGIKITVDTLVQHHIDDGYRGRVFTLYDTLFNVALVLAAVLTALFLPDDGYSPAAIVALALVYALTAVAYVSGCRRTTG